jgi:hypothetical protein
MPKRSRRKFIADWKVNKGCSEPHPLWYLIAARLAKKCRQQSDRLEYFAGEWNKYREVAQLYDMGVNLSRVSTLAIENHRLREALDNVAFASSSDNPFRIHR